MSSHHSCFHCKKVPSGSEPPLKRCSKCKVANYCTRECQLDDWKAHKKVCANLANLDNNSPSPAEKPSHKLDIASWFGSKPEKEVFTLLIDTYRMRMEDNYMFGNVDDDGLYAGNPDGKKGFIRFLTLAEKRPGILPSWWTKGKSKECIEFAMHDDWANVSFCVEKHDISDHYKNNLMPMQLRMLGEQIYGVGIGG